LGGELDWWISDLERPGRRIMTSLSTAPRLRKTNVKSDNSTSDLVLLLVGFQPSQDGTALAATSPQYSLCINNLLPPSRPELEKPRTGEFRDPGTVAGTSLIDRSMGRT
jgi:hypothetical protein